MAILKLLDPCSVLRLLRCNKALVSAATPELVVASFVETRKDRILKEAREQKTHHFGYVFQHQYSFDGKSSVPFQNLRGRDAIICTVLRHVFGWSAVITRSCVVREEKHEDRDYSVSDFWE